MLEATPVDRFALADFFVAPARLPAAGDFFAAALRPAGFIATGLRATFFPTDLLVDFLADLVAGLATAVRAGLRAAAVAFFFAADAGLAAFADAAVPVPLLAADLPREIFFSAPEGGSTPRN